MTGLFDELCSKENLELAFKKARKGKTLKDYVIKFEAELEDNLAKLRNELLFQTYKPKPLETFILRDPKTRKISKSDFRDRVIHHAVCNIIEPFFEKNFIVDSFANRIGKGTLKAIKRFEYYSRKQSRGFTKPCYVLKADIRHYFDTVDHKILLSILEQKIYDKKVINLIKIILKNHQTKVKGKGSANQRFAGLSSQARKGMPLGNLTSQFFANVYLNKLDQFVKHRLKAKYYIRYVDDFVILDSSIQKLAYHKKEINKFLKTTLDLTLHPEKSRILQLTNGIGFLGMRIYPYHKRIVKKNIRRFDKKISLLKKRYNTGTVEYETVVEHLEGWLAYISHANTFKYRKHLVRQFNKTFSITSKAEPKNITKHKNFVNKSEEASLKFSVQKTLYLWKKGKTIEEIAREREIKVSTVWQHLANLIEYNQLSVWRLLSRDKIKHILQNIKSENETLKAIKTRINNKCISFDEINCVLSHVKSKNRAKNVMHHINWYKKIHCLRKCYFDKKQRQSCSKKFDLFITQNPDLKIKRKEFLELFNNYMNICILPEKEKKNFISWNRFKTKIRKKYFVPTKVLQNL